MRVVLAALMALAPLAAAAEGFSVADLRAVKITPKDFAGGSYRVDQDRDRAVIACVDCPDLTVIGLRLGRSTDGTEGRFRSGETTIEKMETLCQDRDPECRLTRVDVGDATGWVSQYRLGPTEGSTAVLFLDGDMLTIRSLSESRNRTGSNMAAALRSIAPQIVGSP